MRVLVVGGMNLDLLGWPGQPLQPRDSTPGRIVSRPGGVGRNIAARLAALGAEVSLLSVLGDDAWARLLTEACARDGIDLSLSLKTAYPSPCYLCVHDEQGDMLAGVNDMRALEALTPQALEARLPTLAGFDGCVLDANLAPDTLAFAARHIPLPLILDPVSVAKAGRVQPLLNRLAAIKPNLMEAEALTGCQGAPAAAERLLASGVRRVFISLGAEGVYYADAESRGRLPAQPLPARPLTGAGDAFCAGMTRALLSGKATADCARDGLAAAYDALCAAF